MPPRSAIISRYVLCLAVCCGTLLMNQPSYFNCRCRLWLWCVAPSSSSPSHYPTLFLHLSLSITAPLSFMLSSLSFYPLPPVSLPILLLGFSSSLCCLAFGVGPLCWCAVEVLMPIASTHTRIIWCKGELCCGVEVEKDGDCGVG